MARPQLILCERRGIWAVAVARSCTPAVRIRQVRSLVECSAELANAPESIVALELLSGNLAAVLKFVDGLEREFPRALAMIFADRQLANYEPAMREAGAICFACSPRELEGIGPTVHRHLSRTIQPPANCAAQIWEALPWSEAALA